MNFSDSYQERFFMLVERLRHALPCSSRQDAHDLLLRLWIDVARQAGAPQRLLQKMKTRTISQGNGWLGIDSDPCYWQSTTNPGVRISLHHDGAIVMQRINDSTSSEILFYQPGTGCKTVETARGNH